MWPFMQNINASYILIIYTKGLEFPSLYKLFVTQMENTSMLTLSRFKKESLNNIGVIGLSLFLA